MKRGLEAFAFTLLGLGAVVLITAIIIFCWNETFSSSMSVNTSKFADLGSFASGLVGSFWGLAGVIFFIVALSEQRKDIQTNRKALNMQVQALNQQIKEFELQRAELEETRKVFLDQTETQKLQRFEHTFFQLLTVHSNIVNSIDLRRNSQIVSTGRDCFTSIYHEIRSQVRFGSQQDVLKYYENAYEKHHADLGHYFRNLYHVFKFIDTSDIEQKRRYASLVRAQLSTNELILLFYNGLTSNGAEKFKPLIEKYEVFKNLAPNLIEGDQKILSSYSPTAFAKKDYRFINKLFDQAL